MKLGLIAGNGRFPFLLLDAARAQGACGWWWRRFARRPTPEMEERAGADDGRSRWSGFRSASCRG
jgi:hypothetical protein